MLRIKRESLLVDGRGTDKMSELPELPVNEQDEKYGRIVSQVITEWLMLMYGPASVPLGLSVFTGRERLNCVAVGVRLQEWLSKEKEDDDVTGS